MNARETLQKIAEALNIATAVKEEQTAVEAPVTEEVESITEELVTEEAQAEPVAEVSEQEETDEPTEEPAAEEQKDARVEELEKQLAELREILKNAMSEPVAEELPVAPAAEPKGLTHSPEKSVSSAKRSGIGKKGESIQDRVFRYINNN